MSIRNPNQRDLEAAYYAGLSANQGELEEVGIPSSPEAFASHVESGKQVRALLGAAGALGEVETLPHGANLGNYAGVPDEQKAINRAGVQKVRDALNRD